MYQALYRKYRPKNFDEVVGQEVIVQTLINSIVNKKISHAYLFTGPRGTGKTTIAKIFAKTINCTDPVKGIPCDKCVNCTQINLKQSTDIIEIDAASNNGVDEIREIRDKVNLVPSTSKYKVYIIDEVHMLTTGAFNALLKTLEEPPAHVIFVLATTEPHKIPLTILSRCQRFDFKKIVTEKILLRLNAIIAEEKIEIETEALNEIAYLSDGGMRDSISLLDQTYSYSNEKIKIQDVHAVNGTISKKELVMFLENIFFGNIKESLETIKMYDASGKNLVKIVEELVVLLKDILIYKLVPNYFPADAAKEYDKVSGGITEININYVIDSFSDAINKLKNSDNPKILLDLLLMRMFYFINSDKRRVSTEEKTVVAIAAKSVTVPVLEPTLAINIEPDQIEKKEIEVKEIEVIFPNNTETKTFKNHDKIKQIQNQRIENILAEFDKQKLNDAKKNISLVNDYLFDSNYNKIVSIILDGELKAASNRGLMFVYGSELLSNNFNQNITLIEELIEKIFQTKHHVIALEKNNWEIIKKEFNTKAKEYVYIDEDYKIEDIFSTTSNLDKNEINSFFGDIVEYS